MTKYLNIILILIFIPLIADAGTFGFFVDQPGGGYQNVMDTIRLARGVDYICPSNGVGDSLSVILLSYNPGTRMRMGLFDSAGNVIDTTEEIKTTSSGSVVKYNVSFLNAPNLIQSKHYMIGVWTLDTSADYNRVVWDTATGDTSYYDAEAYANPWPDPVTPVFNTAGYCARVGCYYTETSTATLPKNQHGPDGAGEAHSIRGAREGHGP